LSQDESVDYLNLSDLVQKTLQLPGSIQWIVRNHWWWHINHSMFRELMTPNWSELQEWFKKVIESKFWSVDWLKEDFNSKALALFWSWWTWLILNTNSELEVKNYSNQDNPYMFWEKPILGIDLWEHAYYLWNQNRRNEYLTKRWNVVNRNQVEKNLQ
jgi:Fe-Mn family superoxide dismutase